MNGTRTCRYPDLQVALHWIIAFLVIVQAFVTNGATGRMAEAKEKGLALSLASRIGAKLHVAFGVTVFLLAPVRVGVRLHRGAPLRPDDDPMTTQLAPHLHSRAALHCHPADSRQRAHRLVIADRVDQ